MRPVCCEGCQTLSRATDLSRVIITVVGLDLKTLMEIFSQTGAS